MSSQTTNYKLIKPEGQDNADISVVGESMEIIDAQLKKLNDEKLAKTGGEITGDLTVKKSYPGIYLANDAVDREFRAILFDNNGNIEVSNYKDTNNYQGVRVMKETADIKTAVKLIRAKEGAFSEYNLYGEHNKPTPAELGAVNRAGDTMTNNLAIAKTGAPRLVLRTLDIDESAILQMDEAGRASIQSVKDDNNFNALYVSNSDAELNDMLKFRIRKNGVDAWHTIIHTGNLQNITGIAPASVE